MPKFKWHRKYPIDLYSDAITIKFDGEQGDFAILRLHCCSTSTDLGGKRGRFGVNVRAEIYRIAFMRNNQIVNALFHDFLAFRSPIYSLH